MLAGDTDDAVPHRALSTAAPAVGAWTHLAGVHDTAAGELRLYVNGALHGRVPHAGAWHAVGALQIGRGKWNGNPTDFFGRGFPWALGIDRKRSTGAPRPAGGP